MAFLHVKTPNGSTQTLNLNTMNMQNGGDTRSGWWYFPNGMIVQYHHKYYSQMTIDANGVASWTLPLADYWNTRLVLVSIDSAASYQNLYTSLFRLDVSNIYIIAFYNGTRITWRDATNYQIYILVIDGPLFN